MIDQPIGASAPVTVSFHGQTLYLVDYQGEPFVPMKPIVEGMGLNWPGQYEKLKVDRARWGIRVIHIPSGGGPQDALCLPLRKLPGWLMTLHPNKVRHELRERVRRYQAECDDVLWQHWGRTHPAQATVQPAALPPPAPGLSREVRAFVNRRAHALSLAHYDRLREDLLAAVEKYGVGRSEAELLALAASIELPDSHLVLVHRNDLWQVTQRLARMGRLFASAMLMLHNLEVNTGRQWYARDDPGAARPGWPEAMGA
jgi:hypothetical protein